VVAFRIVVASLLVACAVPIFVLALAAAIGTAGGCPLQFETAHTCTIAGMNAGWLVDSLIPFGAWGALAGGLAVYLFALWVITELVMIVARALRRR